LGLYDSEIKRRRTFAIISHPDAGKTTLTEKLLLYGGVIQKAGSVKGKATAKTAVSDWMQIEKERGISVTSSVLQFEYEGSCVNILDTPGHQDFSEDTYRTLMAADSAVMVIDAAKGVEEQTRKLFKVCAMRKIPIFTFINKMDRDADDIFSLLDQVENELGIAACPVNWPIGSGKSFAGIYDRHLRKVFLYSETKKGTVLGEEETIELEEAAATYLTERIGNEACEYLTEQMELLEGAGAKFDLSAVLSGEQTPVFFGSALTNFGVRNFLEYYLKMSPPPAARMADCGIIDPCEAPFSAFIFKIQANMNKAHRDRIAFIRIVSGKFDADKQVRLAGKGRELRLMQPQQIMANERKVLESAYAGDVIGIFDPGIFEIGDTLLAPGNEFKFEAIPRFAPEHFAGARLIDSMKRKQFVKGVTQIAKEGAVQIFLEPSGGMEEIIIGVVGVLQFEVLKYRLLNEYNVEIIIEDLPYSQIRWIRNEGFDFDGLTGTSDMKKLRDTDGNPIVLFVHPWSIKMTQERNKGLLLEER